ncbi:MAG: Asp-tRNA(Asn)/Glu-tRNA(Gln) amidotransferase subunit GatA, partial [Mailhella sp.]|nr:Asp-tRNA(Asn)/Glu-tRNA(Gln) amidotransferase subunit GatA [Mailhella sp.]
AIAGHDERDSTSSPEPSGNYLEKRSDLKGLTVGLPREFYESGGMDPAVAAVCQNTIREAERLGAKTVSVSMPHLPYSIAAYYIIATAEASSNLARFDGIRYGRRAAAPKDIDEMYTRSRTEGFGQEVQRRILLGTFVLSSGYYDAYYRKAAQVRRLIRADYENALKECDFMLAPVSPVPAWKMGGVTDPLQMYRLDIFTLSLNLAGLPGLSIPAGSAGGLPVGIQLMGRAFDEKTLFSAGHALANALGTDGQHAPL